MPDINFLPNPPKKKRPEEKKKDEKMSEPKEEIIKIKEAVPITDYKPSGFSKITALFKGVFGKRNDLGLAGFRREVLETIQEKNEKPIKNNIVAPSAMVVEKRGLPKKEEKSGELPQKTGEKSKKIEAPQEEKEIKKSVLQMPQRSWEKLNVLETNLMEGEIVSFFNWDRAIMQFMVSFVIVFIILGGVYGGLTYWEKNENKRIEELTKISDQKNWEIISSEKEKEKIYIFIRKMELAEYLLKNHAYWTNLFKFFEANTLLDVYYGNFKGDETGQYTLPASAKNYDAVAKQLGYLQNIINNQKERSKNKEFNEVPILLEANTDGASMSGRGEDLKNTVGFSLYLKLNPEIFKYDSN